MSLAMPPPPPPPPPAPSSARAAFIFRNLSRSPSACICARSSIAFSTASGGVIDVMKKSTRSIP